MPAPVERNQKNVRRLYKDLVCPIFTGCKLIVHEMNHIHRMPNNPRSMLSDAMRDLLPYSALGWQLVASILVCFGIGYGLDAWLGTKPVLTVVLAVVGVVVGLVSFFRTAQSLTKRSKNESQ